MQKYVPDGSLYSHTLNPRARLFIPGVSHTDINSDARNISLNPRSHVFVSRVCVSDICEYSAVNVNAKEFIPFSTLNSGKAINYVINSVNSRLGAIVATSFILAIFIFNSLGFLEIRHLNITPKNHIKQIKHNHPNNIVLGHLNINSIRNKFQCLEYNILLVKILIFYSYLNGN